MTTAVAPANPSRLTQADLASIIERALEEARSRGATQAEAAVTFRHLAISHSRQR